MSSVDRALSSIRVISSRRCEAHRPPVPSDGAPPQLLVIPEHDDLHVDIGGRRHLVRSDQLAVVCPAEGDAIALTREIQAESSSEMRSVFGVEAIAFKSRGHVYTLLEQELPRTIVVDSTPLLASVVVGRGRDEGVMSRRELRDGPSLRPRTHTVLRRADIGERRGRAVDVEQGHIGHRAGDRYDVAPTAPRVPGEPGR